MELYLRWLAKYEQEPGEAAPLDIILCVGKKQDKIGLADLEESGIDVVDYFTVLPSREVFLEKLHPSIETARRRMRERGDEER